MLLSRLVGPAPVHALVEGHSSGHVDIADASARASKSIQLGVNLLHYGERDYARTQNIGEAAAQIGIDGLIAPSARWPCDNLVVFTDNLAPHERLEVVDSEDVNWRAWARAHGFLTPPDARP